VSEPTRIALRLLGFALLFLGVAGIVLLFKPGPGEIAEWMGKNCAHTKHGEAEQCNVLDVIDVMSVAPILILVGAVMALALRPEGDGPATIDLSRFRR
jgi:uncharacterized iron-regulated membrane protein